MRSKRKSENEWKSKITNQTVVFVAHAHFQPIKAWQADRETFYWLKMASVEVSTTFESLHVSFYRVFHELTHLNSDTLDVVDVQCWGTLCKIWDKIMKLKRKFHSKVWEQVCTTICFGLKKCPHLLFSCVLIRVTCKLHNAIATNCICFDSLVFIGHSLELSFR